MATILNNKKSTYSSPYAYYTVEVTGISNRTATSVDITFKITSNLASSSSKLGKGYTLKSNLYIKEDWSEDIELKSSSESWSGTTKHYKPQTITVTGLSSNNTTLSNIKFKVVSSASDHAAGLNATNCENITIPIYHQPPTFTTTIEELNQNLINANVSNDVFIKDLSKKRITFNVTTYESAELWSVIAKNKESNDSRNENTWINAGGDNKLIIDLKDITLIEYINNLQHVLLSYSVTDDLGGQAEYKNVIYPYTLYNKPAIIEDNTFVKRAGQLSGNVSLTINGSYYNNLVGDTTPTIRHIYYKYWQVGSTEPSTYTNEIPTASITASNGQFNVNNYVVSNIDPQIAYRFKIKVEDDFSEYETAEYPIAVGKPIWTEHKDYVDYEKLTIKKNDIYNELFHSNGDILELGANSGDERYCINGFITVSTTTLLFNIHTDKSMKDINTITCLELNVESRGINGYLNSTSGYVDYVGLSGYTINCYKVDNHNIRVAVKKSSAFTNTTNNTPISLNGYFKFELSYVE